ncbi:LAFA_0E08130g1_1 [Lachancea sp. 'fantastica']|nr:LAFA_0E08130g1_1 [Lachancea sp. 'fantastica']
MTVPKSAVQAPSSGLAAVQPKNPSSWDPQDDVLLRHLKEVRKLGWKEIAQYFKNRTPNACQFRWRRLRSGNLKTTGKNPSDGHSEDQLGAGSGAQAGTGTGTGTGNGNETGVSSSSSDGTVDVVPPVTSCLTKPDTAVSAAGIDPLSSMASQPASDHVASPLAIRSHAASHGEDLSATSTTASSRSMTHLVPSVMPGTPYMESPAVISNSTPIAGLSFRNPQDSSQFAHGFPSYQQFPQQHSTSQRPPAHTHTGPEKFVKPRSYSHTMAPPSGLLHSSSASHLPSTDVNKTSEDENIGLIPKVLVRSRRASVAQHPPLPHSAISTPALSSASSFSNLSAALNTTLTTSKLRKNSFSSRPRRSSFQMAAPDRNFSTPSRRGSVVQAPSSVASLTRRESFNNPPSRRGSSIQARRESFVQPPMSRRESISNYTDVPRASMATFTPVMKTGLSHAGLVPDPSHWSSDEDRLLHDRREKHLSLDEISILLPHRSEQEIQVRIGTLGISSSSPTSNSPLDSPDRSLTEETAIEEETNADADDNSRAPSQVVFDIKKEVSPSLSLSSGSNGRENSPVFSPHPTNRDASPATFETSTKSGINQSLEQSKFSCSPGLTDHRGISYTPVNSRSNSVTHNAALPPLNSLFKNIL